MAGDVRGAIGWAGLAVAIAVVGAACASGEETTQKDRAPASRAGASGGDSEGESPEEGGASSRGEQCEIVARDWRGLDFHDAASLHRSIADQSSRLRPCLEVFPSNEKFFVVFEVKPPRIATARPADLSKNLLRRIEEEEREALRSCLEKRVSELDVEVEPLSDAYEVTHPFCTP